MPEPACESYVVSFPAGGNSTGPSSWGPDARVWYDDEGQIVKLEAWNAQAERLRDAHERWDGKDPVELALVIR